jgi:hypothetical protein
MVESKILTSLGIWEVPLMDSREDLFRKQAGEQNAFQKEFFYLK